MEDGSSKGRHPHSKSSCRREAAGAAETGFLAPSRVAWAGSADLQNGIWTWHHLRHPTPACYPRARNRADGFSDIVFLGQIRQALAS